LGYRLKFNPNDFLCPATITKLWSLQNRFRGEIKKAYRSLARKYHPDRNPGDKQAEKNFKDQDAYDVSAIQPEGQYDQFGFAGPPTRFRPAAARGYTFHWGGGGFPGAEGIDPARPRTSSVSCSAVPG